MADNGPIMTAEKSGDVEMGLTNTASPPPAYGANKDDQPPSYDEGGVGGPPSYKSIMEKIKEAKEESSTPVHFFGGVTRVLLKSVATTIFILLSLAVPIAMIVMGSLYLDDCPIQRLIPIYLIVQGSFYILKSLIDLWVRFRKRNVDCDDPDQPNTKVEDAISRVIGMFLFGFFIAGNVWVYGSFAPSNNPLSLRYCYGPLYYFAFWVITSVYIAMAFACCCLCSIACCVACCITGGVAAAASKNKQQNSESQ